MTSRSAPIAPIDRPSVRRGAETGRTSDSENRPFGRRRQGCWDGEEQGERKQGAASTKPAGGSINASEEEAKMRREKEEEEEEQGRTDTRQEEAGRRKTKR